ncbi:hypothetical protein [Bradyrhizobium sp.]|uniref:hypothetical protein n=1 Tax=Bradyrhizobium sp. TaxID=376 RepID=UPI003C5B7A72
MVTSLLGILGGFALGMRFRVFCLIPVVVSGIAAIAVLDRMDSVPLGSTVLSAIVFTVTLQIGYFAGVAARSVPAAVPVARTAEQAPLHDRSAATS